jgi:hypothetical protein
LCFSEPGYQIEAESTVSISERTAMSSILVIAPLALIAASGVIASVVVAVRDGYGRVPTRAIR